jgi:hypothetical protein
MLRKHFNQNVNHHLDPMPFRYWECITITVGQREIDLVIQDEKMMDMFLKLLIWKLNTIDGIRGTALSVKKLLFDQHLQTQPNAN